MPVFHEYRNNSTILKQYTVVQSYQDLPRATQSSEETRPRGAPWRVLSDC